MEILNILEIFVTLLVWALIGTFFIAGLGITLIGLPGIWLIFAGIFISAIHNGFTQISIGALLIFGLLAFIISLLDNLIIPYSTKYTGGSRWAVIGAIVGGIVGLFVGNIVGAILGPFFGAVIFEYLFAKNHWKSSLKVGLGTFIGFFLTVGIKFGSSVALIVLWAILRFG